MNWGRTGSWRWRWSVPVLAIALAAPAAAGADTLAVTTPANVVANDGECSLREAVTATNSNTTVFGGDDCKHDGGTGPDVIELVADTYPVTGAAGEDANASGDLDVEAGEKLTIGGEGKARTHLDGDLDRVVHLESGKLVLSRLEVTDGDAGAARGGGVLVDGEGGLKLERATVSESEAARGGGIAIDDFAARLTLNRSTVSANTADGGSTSDDGGGIYFDGAAATIDRSTLSGNESLAGEGGGLDVTGQSGGFTVTGSSIVGNHADARAGGGINYNLPEGKITIAQSLISQNTARFAGGGLRIGQDPNTAIVKRSMISNNALTSSASEVIGGAGIANAGVARVRDSVVAANTLVSLNGMAIRLGVGIRNSSGVEMTIAGSLLTGNTSSNAIGGAIYSEQPLAATNTTIAGNDAGTGAGGGMHVAAGATSLAHMTFTANESDGDGDAIDLGAPVEIRGSIIANGPDACDDVLTSLGFNLDEGASCGLAGQGDLDSTPAKLLPLQDNGGPVIGPPGFEVAPLTNALKKSSEAVDRVPKAQCLDAADKPLRIDQRREPRPGGKRCDSGAYERRG